MKKRLLTLAIIFALIFTLAPAGVRSIELSSITLTAIELHDDGSLKGFHLSFYTAATLTVKGTKDYHWVSGQNGVSTDGGASGLAFRSDDESNGAEPSQLDGVYVDGNLLTPSRDYTASRGSVIVALTPSYLQTLPRGRHRLTLTYNTTGALSTSFTVTAPVSVASPARSNPNTGF